MMWFAIFCIALCIGILVGEWLWRRKHPMPDDPEWLKNRKD